MRFIWPLPQIVSRDFYYLSSIYIGGQHGGLDIPASLGTPIKAIASGKVTKTGRTNISGYFVEIAYADGWVSNYRHMVQPAAGDVGAGVSQGQVVGKVGSTGWSTGPHLHLDLWNPIKQSPEAMYKNGIWAHDPELYLGKEEYEVDEDEEDDDMEFLLAVEGRTDIYAWRLGGKYAVHVNLSAFNAMKKDGVHVLKVSQAGMAKLTVIE